MDAQTFVPYKARSTLQLGDARNAGGRIVIPPEKVARFPDPVSLDREKLTVTLDSSSPARPSFPAAEQRAVFVYSGPEQ